MIGRKDVEAAWSLIRPYVRRTPALEPAKGSLGLRQPLAEHIQVREELRVLDQAHLHLDLLGLFCPDLLFLLNRDERDLGMSADGVHRARGGLQTHQQQTGEEPAAPDVPTHRAISRTHDHKSSSKQCGYMVRPIALIEKPKDQMFWGSGIDRHDVLERS